MTFRLLDQLKEITNTPETYLYEYFFKLKHDIDVAAETFMSNLSETETAKMNAQRNWMIQRIDSIQKECKEKLNHGEWKMEITKHSILNYEQRLKTVEQDITLGFLNHGAQFLLNSISSAVNRLKSVLFTNKTIIFDNFKIEEPDEFQKENGFGRLIILHGLHVNETDHEHIKVYLRNTQIYSFKDLLDSDIKNSNSSVIEELTSQDCLQIINLSETIKELRESKKQFTHEETQNTVDLIYQIGTSIKQEPTCFKKENYFGILNIINLDLNNIGLNSFEKSTFNQLDKLDGFKFDYNNRLCELSANQILPNNNINSKLIQFDSNSFTLRQNGFNHLLERKIKSQKSIYFNLLDLKYLDLSGNKFVSIDSKSFEYFSSLTRLDLSRNEIVTLSLNNLPKLFSLNLSSNKINNVLFNNLIQLKELNLKENDLKSLTIGGFLRCLTELNYLNLSMNDIQNIHKEAFSCMHNSLNVIDISFNSINCLDGLNSLHNLKELNVSNNKLVEIKLDDLKQFKFLEKLYLDNNKISTIQCESFASLYSLVSLDLSNNELKQIDQNLLYGLFNLIELNLSNNKINALSSNAFLNTIKLESLNLSNNSIKAIEYNTLTGMFNLKRLDLAKNQISLIQSNAFKDQHALENLNLFSNKLTLIDCNCFEVLTNLVSLNVKANQIEEIRLDAFRGMNNLRTIELRNNRIKSLDSKVYDYLQSIEIILT